MRPRNKELDREIGKRIRLLRKKQHLTLEQLAEKMGIGPKHMGEVERGNSGLSLEKLILTSEVLDCSLDYLISGKQLKDIHLTIPASLLELCRQEEASDMELLEEYLQMYTKIRKK